MDAILSIKPQFVEEIIAGRKTYEFRKKGFKERVRKVYVYASSPVCRIIGEFTLGQILEGQPDIIWSKTSNHAGITRAYFDEYYNKRKIAYALEIKSFKVYDEPINPYIILERFNPPQSFCYVRSDLLGKVEHSLYPKLL
ncbi:MAG: hypothetical protein J6T82_00690 [Bacteroidaceae bacterium]|nr:hypothetical protein [Bacteroidaceae bacterium]